MAPFFDFTADIQALEFDNDEDSAKLAKVLLWDIVPTRCMYPSALRRLGLTRDVWDYLVQMGFWELLSRLSSARTYPVLVAEFVTTYVYGFDGISFRLRGRSFSFNIIQFNLALHLPVRGFRDPPISRVTRESISSWLMGGALLASDPIVCAKDLDDPALRYAQQIVSHALFHTKGHHGLITDSEKHLLMMVCPLNHGIPPPDMGHTWPWSCRRRRMAYLTFG